MDGETLKVTRTVQVNVVVMEFLCVCSLPVEQRRGYSNVFNALARITREEGVTTLWRVRHLNYNT